ncbi:hypothetical protein [Actinoplanes sp. DH11]|uniref:hypothetical protein n=1 Tax=Actinoplanes sp. DH11 TaxID=2857011 RepID=UPI001E58C0FB|nr:hypothetical protein [Actinoplanes sp. DH11]
MTVGSLGPLTELNSGGQGTVYAVPGMPDVVYKQYDNATRATLNETAFAEMVRFPAGLSGGDTAWLARATAWPAAIVEEAGRVTGFLMPRVPPAFWTPMRLGRARKDTLCTAQFLLNGDEFARDRGLAVDDTFRVEFLRDTAEALDRLHRLGVAVGDLSPRNLCFSLTSRPRCYFIDCDAMRLPASTALPQAETPGWHVPPGERLATPEADVYKFALLAVRLFAGSQDERDPGVLHRAGGDLHRLAADSLQTDPRRRPSAAQWRTALDQARPVPAAQPSWYRTATGTARVVPQQARAVPNQAAPGAYRSQPLQPQAQQQSPYQQQPSYQQQPPPYQQQPPPYQQQSPYQQPSHPQQPQWQQPHPPQQAHPTQQRWQPARGPAGPPQAGTWAGRPSPRRLPSGRSILTYAALSLVLLCGLNNLSTIGGWWKATVDTADTVDTGSSPQEQASALATLLDGSGRDRQKVIRAVEDVAGCDRPGRAATALDEAAAGRAALLTRLGGLRTDGLPDGAQLRAELGEALAHSREADEAYAQWARAVSRNGCGSSSMNGDHRDRGDAASKDATAAKKRFVTLWNPTAVRYGHPELTYKQV